MMRKKTEKNSEAIVDLKHSCEILDLVLLYFEATMHLQIQYIFTENHYHIGGKLKQTS